MLTVGLSSRLAFDCTCERSIRARAYRLKEGTSYDHISKNSYCAVLAGCGLLPRGI